MLVIRKATYGDLPLLLALEKQFCRDERRIVINENKLLEPYVRPSPLRKRTVTRFLRRFLRSRNALVLLAEDGGRPVAFSTASIEKGGHMYQPMRFGFIGWVFVKKSHGGKRISSQLMGEMMEWFAKRKIKQITLSVLVPNKHARAIWKKWGFEDLLVFSWKIKERHP